VREYAEAWKEQRTERAVIVWMAESYIHVGESTRYGWFIAGVNSPRANRYKLLRRTSASSSSTPCRFGMLRSKTRIPRFRSEPSLPFGDARGGLHQRKRSQPRGDSYLQEHPSANEEMPCRYTRSACRRSSWCGRR